MNDATCVLCGNEKPQEVRVSLVRWRFPEPAMYSAVPRCIDRKACRVRCEELGDPWLVIDPGEPAISPV